MTLTQELYTAAKPTWDAQLEHPFVKGLGDGSLEEERFRRWVLQDYLYLKEFARIFAWAVAKADRLDSMSWYATVLNLTLNTEMALHRSYAERFGISGEELEATPMWPTTRAYTDFLVRTSAVRVHRAVPGKGQGARGRTLRRLDPAVRLRRVRASR
jgi:thiaminase/transcriptional activator TenA